jgi:hypothetical protein
MLTSVGRIALSAMDRLVDGGLVFASEILLP